MILGVVDAQALERMGAVDLVVPRKYLRPQQFKPCKFARAVESAFVLETIPSRVFLELLRDHPSFEPLDASRTELLLDFFTRVSPPVRRVLKEGILHRSQEVVDDALVNVASDCVLCELSTLPLDK